VQREFLWGSYLGCVVVLFWAACESSLFRACRLTSSKGQTGRKVGTQSQGPTRRSPQRKPGCRREKCGRCAVTSSGNDVSDRRCVRTTSLLDGHETMTRRDCRVMERHRRMAGQRRILRRSAEWRFETYLYLYPASYGSGNSQQRERNL
jgi:hypothetical protein